MISALVFMLAGPLPSSPRPSGSLSPVIGDRCTSCAGENSWQGAPVPSIPTKRMALLPSAQQIKLRRAFLRRARLRVYVRPLAFSFRTDR